MILAVPEPPKPEPVQPAEDPAPEGVASKSKQVTALPTVPKLVAEQLWLYALNEFAKTKTPNANEERNLFLFFNNNDRDVFILLDVVVNTIDCVLYRACNNWIVCSFVGWFGKRSCRVCITHS